MSHLKTLAERIKWAQDKIASTPATTPDAVIKERELNAGEKRKFSITKKILNPVERLKLQLIKLEQPENDDVFIYNPITYKNISNTASNRKRIKAQVEKYNAKVNDKIEIVQLQRAYAPIGTFHLKMPVEGDPKDDNVIIPKGKYYMSMDLTYDIIGKDGKTVMDDDYKESLVRKIVVEKNNKSLVREIVVEKNNITRYKIADEVAWLFFNKDDRKKKTREKEITVNDDGSIAIYQSGFNNVRYSNLQLDKNKDTQGLETIPMRGKNLGYSLLGDTSIINENVEGCCVPEFIYYECQQQKYRERLTQADVIDELNDVRQAVIEEDWTILANQYINDKEFATPTLDKQRIMSRESEASYMARRKNEYFDMKNRNGYDSRMVVLWAKQRKDVSVHCIDPMYKEFIKHIAEHPRLTLCFILNNEHCYPILNPDIKKDIFSMHRIDMNKIKFKVNDYDNGTVMTKQDLELCNSITEYTRDKKLVFYQANSLKDVVSTVIKETQMIDGAIMMNGAGNTSTITGYKHPTTGTLFIASPYYSDIRNTCIKLNEHYKTSHFAFTNQTWAQLGKQLLNFGWIYPTESVYSAKYLDILEEYKISPYNTKMFEETKGDFQTYDISRSYTKVVMTNKEDYAIFYLNDPEPYNGEKIEAGEYYVNKMIKLGGGTILQRNGFYPSNFINYCLENGYITKKDITAKNKARFSLRADYFKEFVETIYKIFPYSHPACKQLINHLLGTFGIVEKKFQQGCMTTSFDVACAIKLKEENDTTRVSIYNHENQVYFVRKFEQHKETSGHKPIWRHIIAGSIIELDKLYKKLATPETQVLGYYTDSIKGINFKKIELEYNTYEVEHKESAYDESFQFDENQPVPGEEEVFKTAHEKLEEYCKGLDTNGEHLRAEKIRKQQLNNKPEVVLKSKTIQRKLKQFRMDYFMMHRPTKQIIVMETRKVIKKYIGCILPEQKTNIYGTYIHDIKENKPFIVEGKQSWITHKEGENDISFDNIVDIVRDKSCMVNGCAGAGKTEVIKRIVDSHTLTLAFTNKASRDVLNSRGVEAQTIDSYFFKDAGDLPLRKLKKDGITRIVIDEVSMLGLEKFKLLHKIKTMYPEIIVNLFGDFSQCPAVDDIVMDLANENFIKNLCGGVQCILKYKGTRYDMATYEQLEEFNKTGCMPKAWINKAINPNLFTNICKTTRIRKNTRDEVNEACFKVFSVGKAKKIIQLKESVREYCIGMPVFAMMNNRELEIYNSQRFKIEAFTSDGVKLEGKDAIVPNKIFGMVFGYGFCDSVYRYQGDAICEEYNIYDVEIMSRNELYTALSRCKNINQVSFTYTTKYFKPVQPTTDIVKTLEKHTRTLKTGFIYKIDFSDERVYIGMTSRTIEERMQEHREFPVSKKMREALASEPGQISVLVQTTYTCEEQLHKIEKKYIKQHNHLGEKLLNTNDRKEEEQLTYKPFNSVAVRKDNNRYVIHDNKNGVLRIYHNDTQKNFKYGKATFAKAMANAVAYRVQLLRRDAGIDF